MEYDEGKGHGCFCKTGHIVRWRRWDRIVSSGPPIFDRTPVSIGTGFPWDTFSEGAMGTFLEKWRRRGDNKSAKRGRRFRLAAGPRVDVTDWTAWWAVVDFGPAYGPRRAVRAATKGKRRDRDEGEN